MDKQTLREIFMDYRTVYDLSMKYLHKQTSQLGITATQFAVLRCLPFSQKITMSELTQKIGCAPSNMTSMIQRLERDGLVATCKNPQDHRETLVFLTELGKQKKEKLEPIYEAFLQEIYFALSPEELQLLSKILKKLKQKLAL